MRQRVQDLISQGDKLFAKRMPLDSLNQQLCENFHVMRADWTRRRYFSEEFASYLMTGRPAMAHRSLKNSIPALMRPRDRQWMWARTHDEKINKDREARAYLDWLSETQYRAMYDPRAVMVRSCKEADGDFTATGNAVLTVEANHWLDGLLIRCWHPRDVVFTEDSALKINQVHHRRTDLTARELKRLWPKAINAEVLRKFETDPDKEITCRRIVMPSDEYDLAVRNKARFPSVSITVDVEDNIILEETVVRHNPYVIPRWETVSGSQYAYSPAAVYGLPDSRMLQQMTLTLLEAGQKAVDPPLQAVMDAINGGVNTGAGMITTVDADYDERTGPVLKHLIEKYDGLQYGANREERIEGLIDNAFFVNELRMPQVTKEMTATEEHDLYEQYLTNALPLLEPVEVEYNAALCSACYEVITQLGLFGDPRAMPQILGGQDLRWDFDTPLKAATERAKVPMFSQCTDIAAKAAQIDPSFVINFDVNKGGRDAIIASGGADWLLDEDKVAQLRQQHAEEQQAQQTAQQMAQGADVATKVGTAAKAAGDAGQSLQGAGLM